MKKISFMSIALVLILLLVVGCAAEQPAPAEPKNTEEPAETPEVSEPKDEFDPQILFNGSSTLAPVMASISTNFIEGFVTWDKVDTSFPHRKV